MRELKLEGALREGDARVGFLRRAWVNLDPIWSVALVASGAVTLMM